MRNYNRMVARTNELIQIVYKNKIKEQEMLVERQNAELLALHSQINPHFLFNALESIRMHSLLKNEYETADMVEKLALMQRQYVESVSYTHLRAHETGRNLVCRLLLEKKKNTEKKKKTIQNKKKKRK